MADHDSTPSPTAAPTQPQTPKQAYDEAAYDAQLIGEVIGDLAAAMRDAAIECRARGISWLAEQLAARFNVMEVTRGAL